MSEDGGSRSDGYQALALFTGVRGRRVCKSTHQASIDSMLRSIRGTQYRCKEEGG